MWVVVLQRQMVMRDGAGTVKICDFSQVPVISPATAVITGVPQLSVALLAATTLATVGKVAGLKPIERADGVRVNTGFPGSGDDE